jgi:molybdopterin/thiamine biosynthesis adenylyltransferase
MADKEAENRGVLVVGVGGLGAAAALELASGGVRRIGLVDPDRVELSNLHRQLLHGPSDVGCAKTESAAAKLVTLHPEVTVDARPRRLDSDCADAILAGYDFVIDATDHPPTKFLLNDRCVKAGKPFVYAGVVGFTGQMMTVLPGETACLRCLFPQPPDETEVASCAGAGILGPLAALVGTLQGIEALKYLGGAGDLVADRLLTIDARTLRMREVALRRSPACPVCAAQRRHASFVDSSPGKEMS